MKWDINHKFEGNQRRAASASIRGKSGEIGKFTGEPEQFPQDYKRPVVVMIVKCVEGHSYTSRYADKRFVVLEDIHGIYTYQTESRKRLLDRHGRLMNRIRSQPRGKGRGL